ncbi:MAG: hypothetical protein M0C28_26635 [Candidatus Moduliflexus flocculans]|nr:hypothetical protein [Candidatus Moduliflexus flocculans]
MRRRTLRPRSGRRAGRGRVRRPSAGTLEAGPAAAQERFRRTPPLPDAQPARAQASRRRKGGPAQRADGGRRRQARRRLVTLQLVIRAGEADSPAGRPGRGRRDGPHDRQGTRRCSRPITSRTASRPSAPSSP